MISKEKQDNTTETRRKNNLMRLILCVSVPLWQVCSYFFPISPWARHLSKMLWHCAADCFTDSSAV